MAAVYIAFMTYGIELYIWGNHGVLAYRDLAEYKHKLERNIEELKETGYSLAREADSLQYSAEKVALYARKLGYFSPEDKHVKVQGMNIQKDYYLVGELVKPYSRTEINQNVFRIIAVLTGSIAYIILRYRKHI